MEENTPPVIISYDPKDKEVSETVTVQIPECCREGWDTCVHRVNRDEKPIKTNIGL